MLRPSELGEGPIWFKNREIESEGVSLPKKSGNRSGIAVPGGDLFTPSFGWFL